MTKEVGQVQARALTPGELADRWSLTPQALAQWRSKGEGPQFLKLGRAVRYRMTDVLAHEESSLRSHEAPDDTEGE